MPLLWTWYAVLKSTLIILSVLLTLFNAKSSFLKEQGANAQKYVCFSPDRKTWGVDLFCSFLFLDWNPLENLNKWPTCFSCTNFETNLIKGGSTEKLGVLHDVHLQIFWVIIQYDSLHPSVYPCLQTWDVAVFMGLTCSYIQKKVPHLFCSASAIKTGSGGKFHLTEKMLQLWPPEFCSFLSDSFQDMSGQHSKFASEEMTGTPATGSMWKRGARNSLIPAKQVA